MAAFFQEMKNRERTMPSAPAEGTAESYEKVKIMLEGEERVGKTCIFNAYLRQNVFSKYEPTTGVEFGKKAMSFQGEKYNLILWDTPGDQRYNFLVKNTARHADALVIVYDITCKQSLDTALQRIPELKLMMGSQVASNCALVLVGNKLDLKDDREVTTEDGKARAEKCGASFIECSVYSNSNIDDIFQLLMKERFQKLGKTMNWWKK